MNQKCYEFWQKPFGRIITRKFVLGASRYRGTPPLDCVGTNEELGGSLQVAAAQGKFSSSTLMQAAGLKGILNDTGENHISAMLALQPEDALPTELHEEITTWMEQYLK